MKVVINSKYEYLRDWIEQMPVNFDRGVGVIQDDRNIIKILTLDNGLKVNVKRFKTPH